MAGTVAHVTQNQILRIASNLLWEGGLALPLPSRNAELLQRRLPTFNPRITPQNRTEQKSHPAASLHLAPSNDHHCSISHLWTQQKRSRSPTVLHFNSLRRRRTPKCPTKALTIPTPLMPGSTPRNLAPIESRKFRRWVLVLGYDLFWLWG